MAESSALSSPEAHFESRKRDHLEHSLDPANQAIGSGGLDSVQLIHEALPDLNFEEISLATRCLSRELPTPFFVAAMTAGHAGAPALNLLLAEACERRGWAMGVGSQRRELEAIEAGRETDPSLDRWHQLREKAPKLMLFANLGLSQVIQARTETIAQLIETLTAQALCIHLNAHQEVMQPEGTPQFRGGLARIRELVRELEVPVILKETGCGFSAGTLTRVASTGIAALDVSGLGGTHWGRIEGARARVQQDDLRQRILARASATFANWGESTADSVRAAARKLNPRTEIWATGGVRSGLDAAKLIALGAHRVGYAQPALQAAMQGHATLDEWMTQQELELKIALFGTGTATPEALRGRADLIRGGAV